MAKRVLSAAEIAAKWAARMKSGDTKKAYIDGIQSTAVNPMALAASAESEELYVRNVAESVSSGRRRQALLDADPNSWKSNATTTGAERLSSGATKAQPKVAKVMQKWAAVYQSIRDRVASMPKGGRENAKARVAAAIDALMDAAGRS